MKHGVKLKKLGRTQSHRKALIKNMLKSLIKHEKMITTVEKAKALRSYVEKLITRAKVDTTHNRRIVFSRLESKTGVTKLFDDIGKRYANRMGGYTRVLKLYNRKGDNAAMALIELVEEELTPKTKKTPSSKGVKKSNKVKPQEVKENKLPEEVQEVENENISNSIEEESTEEKSQQ